jgi:hypothetical protein
MHLPPALQNKAEEAPGHHPIVPVQLKSTQITLTENCPKMANGPLVASGLNMTSVRQKAAVKLRGCAK